MMSYKKLMSGMVVMGMLTSMVGVAYADTTTDGASASVSQVSEWDRGAKRAGGMGALSLENLQATIASLDAEQQEAIVALYEQMVALEGEQPQLATERPEKMALTEEQQAIRDQYQAQIQPLNAEIMAILEENQLLDETMAGSALTKPEPSDQAPSGDAKRMKGFRGGFGQLEEKIAQLSTEDQEAVAALQAQIKALMETECQALGLEMPEPPTDEARAESANGELSEVKQLRMQLMEALKDAGVTMDMPAPAQAPTESVAV